MYSIDDTWYIQVIFLKWYDDDDDDEEDRELTF